MEICRKYEISSKSVLRGWIKRYNSHNELNTTKGRVDAVMTKGRKTNQKEKVEIAKYCIKQNKDYHVTSKIYKISYQQVYQWVKKFEELGEDGLIDHRGKSKLELSQEDKEKIEIRNLKKDNERLRMQNDFLKKLQELERAGILTSYITKFKYEAIQLLNKEKNYPIISLCDIAGISRSSYYKWLNRVDIKNDKINERLIKEIINLYEKVDGIYGYRRITTNINRKLNS